MVTVSLRPYHKGLTLEARKRDCEFFVLCDDFLGAGSLLEFIEKAKHYD